MQSVLCKALGFAQILISASCEATRSIESRVLWLFKGSHVFFYESVLTIAHTHQQIQPLT